ncbi:MAG: gluconate 5-dehydrogenase [Flavobacteriaceae bacterium TMED179]|mgnify:CR=1 FL=1|nr:MAG: gluconate 5-dehydrogenase [Flavobacteriaceae bacterium TMED179]|tara:strand:+ start:4489 stop:5265 length:777 start_codon:yes stop_codon:yes gene_type:complete
MYLEKLFNLKGKVAAIIGAGGHLCSEMAKSFARAGSKVAIIDLRLHKAQDVEQEINEEGFNDTISLTLDVSVKEDHHKVLNEIINKFETLDILVNGAGINGSTPFLDIEEKEWDNIMNSQIKGTFYGCQVFGEYMLKNKKGSIINISSASAGPPLSKAFTYSAAKAGIKNLTQNLGREWGTKGVRVNAIRPGFFPTDWNLKNFIDDDRKKAILGHTPMNRFGTTNELTGAILWLASDASSFVTGAEITVDGGYSCMTI